MTKTNILSILTIFILTFLSTSLYAQQDSLKKKKSLIGLPLVFFTPETNWGFGGAGIYAFRFRGNSPTSLSSQIQGGFAYTLNKQILSYLSYQLFFKEEKYKLYGEFGYFKYNYFFYGIGSETTEGFRELYDVIFPRIRFNALREIRRDLYIGLRYWMDDFDITGLSNEGLLIKGDITGSNGGFLSGAGLLVTFDNRDKAFYPEKGVFAEAVLFHNGSTLGSDFNFNKLYINASTYLKNKWNHVLAFNFYTELTDGDAPFNQLSLLGGTRKMRGFYVGRYRDNHLLIFQTEYRFPLFWRIGGVAFASYGGVASSFSDFQTKSFRYAVGGGLRLLLDKKEHINLRIDAAYGEGEQLNFYITVGEAF